MKKLLKTTTGTVLRTTAITLVGAIVLLFIGAGCIQDGVIPTYVDEDAAKWANVPTKLFLPYTTLWDAKRVMYAIDYKLAMERMTGGYYKGITNISIMAGEELKATVFSPDGILSMLMIGGPMLALGTYGISKPKDKKRIVELEKNGA